MIKSLFTIYRNSPLPLRRIISPLTVFARFLASPFLKKIAINSHYMYLDSSDNASFKYFTDREGYEKDMVDTFLSTVSLNPGSIVLDIGANYGPYTLSTAAIGRYGLVKQIYAFEPDLRAMKSLEKSILVNNFGHIAKVEQAIVGDKDTTAMLFRSKRSSASNRTFKTSEQTLKFKSGVPVSCLKMETYLASTPHSIEDSFFIIKMDVEGNEYRVLKGLENVLEKCKGFAIFFEFHPLAIKEVGLESKSIHNFMRKINWDYAQSCNGRDMIFQTNESLIDDMKEVENTKDSRMGGMATNYLVSRGLHTIADNQKRHCA